MSLFMEKFNKRYKEAAKVEKTKDKKKKKKGKKKK